MVVISLVFFTVFSVTDKSIYPWRSREQNSPCYLGNFYDTHDFWHLFASFALMMMAMVVVQVCINIQKIVSFFVIISYKYYY